MVDFSAIAQDPTIRKLVQENYLERVFHDSLFPNLIYRQDAEPREWPQGVGDTHVFTASGLMPVDARPLRPGTDPTPVSYEFEQWEAVLRQYAGAAPDTHMPSSIQAIASLLMRNANTLGLQAARTLNVIVRDRMYNAAEQGNTVTNGAQVGVTSLAVKRLNGFTTARSSSGERVRFATVSGSNPLTVTILTTTGPVTRTVTGFTPATAGDELGPGTLTLTGGAVTVNDRAYVIAADRAVPHYVGGGDPQVDSIGSNDLPTLADVRDTIAAFWRNNVPAHGDGRFHCHLDPTSQSKLFSDPEFARLLTGCPDHVMYKEFALGELLNTVFLRNSEAPIAQTVRGGTTASFDDRDPFAGELYNNGATTGVPIHRMLFSGAGGIIEFYQELGQLLTEAGVIGKVGESQVTNNGIVVNSERVQMVFRAPLNRLQDTVSTAWKFMGDWPVRTDALTGDAQRIKRFSLIIHGE